MQHWTWHGTLVQHQRSIACTGMSSQNSLLTLLNSNQATIANVSNVSRPIHSFASVDIV